MSKRAFVVLSAVMTGLRLNIAFRLAAKFGYDGVEVMATYFTTIWGIKRLQGKYDGLKAVSVHGMFWTRRMMWKFLIHGTPNRKMEALYWWVVSGPFETNPVRRIARALELPLVLHPGVILEMRYCGKLRKLKRLLEGLTIWVENDELSYPDGGLAAAIEAYGILKGMGISVRFVVDAEHLAKQFGWTPDRDFMELLNRALEQIPDLDVAQLHLCDIDPGGKGIVGGGHLPFGEGKLPIPEIISLVREGFAETRIVVEVSKESMYKRPRLSRADLSWAEKVAEESIALIRQF